MINFEEEIKKFEPSKEVENADSSIYSDEHRDITDILEEMIKEIKKEN